MPFSFLEYFSYCIKTFFNRFTDFMPYATDLPNENCHLLVNQRDEHRIKCI